MLKTTYNSLVNQEREFNNLPETNSDIVGLVSRPSETLFPTICLLNPESLIIEGLGLVEIDTNNIPMVIMDNLKLHSLLPQLVSSLPSAIVTQYAEIGRMQARALDMLSRLDA